MESYSAEWYKSALNAMHDMVLVKGPDSHLLWANNAFLKYYGMSEDELHQIVDAEHSDPDDTLQYIQDDLTVVETSDALDIQSEAVTDAKGDIRHFHTIKAPILQDGAVVRTVGVSRRLNDKTIRKRDIDHKDAKAFVAPFRALAESFPNPILMVDTRQRVVTSSALWKQQFGDPALPSGTLFSDSHPELNEIAEILNECLTLKTTVQGDISHADNEGQLRTHSARCSPWRYRDGSIGGATIIATDVTDLHAQTADLKTANDELMQFSYRASHDLKGPLSTVKGLARFIAMDIATGDHDDALENANRIEQLMSKLEKTVLSFLSLARADVSDAKYVFVDLKSTVTDICSGLEHAITTSDVDVRTDLQVRHLLSQDTRLTQILENLISNAIKYHDPNKQDRFVVLRTTQGARGFVQITVEDNGCGIPEQAQDRIFDPFARFHEQSEGSGLGLAIVMKHIKALNGFIDVKDTGQGTAFCITLPHETLEMVG